MAIVDMRTKAVLSIMTLTRGLEEYLNREYYFFYWLTNFAADFSYPSYPTVPTGQFAITISSIQKAFGVGLGTWTGEEPFVPADWILPWTISLGHWQYWRWHKTRLRISYPRDTMSC
jgi:hypothetical protein